jgi:hypothetical protein
MELGLTNKAHLFKPSIPRSAALFEVFLDTTEQYAAGVAVIILDTKTLYSLAVKLFVLLLSSKAIL